MTSVISVFDPVYFAYPLPNRTSTIQFPHLFQSVNHVNAGSYRGKQYSQAKPPGTLRIVSLGDSFTFGWAVAENETYSVLLEQYLGAKLRQPVDVVNLGAPGWGTSQNLIRLQREGLAYRPDVVVLNFNNSDPEDDEQAELMTLENGHLVQRTVPPRPFPRGRLFKVPGVSWLRGHSQIWTLLAQWLLTPKQAPPTNSDYALTGALLGEMRRLSQEHRFRLIVLLVADDLVEPSNSPTNYVEAYCRQNGIPLLDTRAWLMHYASNHNLGYNDVFYGRDGHWKPWVHDVAARLLADAVAAQTPTAQGPASHATGR